ncbi:DUF3040 family protein [Arthrobacter sp. SLBN-100]|uniref:DUF3040 domain-containing protein n=1 Tax=Arthrobacter sp. SLBN-100 TaxID=2768450 RepID=UPI00116E63FA|nr:DUF3040 domain-containing protein [Arthrobacter sp. SLBN-100]TQJ66366.1 DUF3040 family protein [Arthrobacter sp. SLBN-100]
MALTEHEQHQLQLLAEQLQREDAHLAAKLCFDPTKPAASTGRTAAGGLMLLVGIVVLLTGVATHVAPLGILGFTIMGTGAYLLSLGVRGRIFRHRPEGPLAG